MSSQNNNRGNKQKRIEKELLQLRNLPREYKLGKRETALGTLLYVSSPPRVMASVARNRESSCDGRVKLGQIY